MSTSIRTSAAAPIIVGARRNGRQRYASARDVRMRYVKSRAAAILATLAVIAGLLLASAPSLADSCEAVYLGTDSVPADVAHICDVAQR